MLLEFKHGGHALPQDAAARDPQVLLRSGSRIVGPDQAGEDFDPDAMTPFRYLFDIAGQDDLLPVGPKTVAALDALGAAMIDQPPASPGNDASIPPIYTYWSQFIDHELTARTDRDEKVSDITVDDAKLQPADRKKVEKDLLNRRTPAIELDCIYGDGPPGRCGDKARRASGRNLELARRMRDGAKMRIGTAEVVNDRDTGEPAGPVPPPASDLNRDLPRIGALLDLGVVTLDDFPPDLRDSKNLRQRAFIGDPRNDENLVIAQFHLAILRFHNAVVDWLRFRDPRKERRDQEELFEDARKIVRWTFQWLVVNDFLPTLLRRDVVQDVLSNGARLYRKQFREEHEPFMPIEFSVAGYRFGHSLIRNGYDFNRNFGGKPDGTPGFVQPFASLDLLFRFTGKSGNPFFGATETLPHNWIIEWDRFDGTLSGPPRVARKIDTHLAPTLLTLPNEGNDAPPDGADPALVEKQKRINELLKHLARRNLRRGYQLSLPTGQALARALGVKPLSRDELSKDNSPEMNKALEDGGFFERTPLWFYVLKEAEVQEGGQRLGQVGSRLVAETIIGVMVSDPESYLAKDHTWDPSKPIRHAGSPLKLSDGRTIRTIGDLLEFAGVRPPAAAPASAPAREPALTV
jgi:hypothetical protein